MSPSERRLYTNPTSRALATKGKAGLPQLGEADYLGLGMRERDRLLEQLASHPELSDDAKAAASDILAKSKEQQQLLGPLKVWEQVAKAGVNPEHVKHLIFAPSQLKGYRPDAAGLAKTHVNVAHLKDGSSVPIGLIRLA